jgi:LAO/AO transport system kinase
LSDSLADRVSGGDRRAVAQAITLVESTRPDHREEARALLDALLPRTGRSMRIGLSGAPGAGKSTFIEAVGLHAVDAGHHVAVLAVDPSSARSGGSVLGDKTRMSDLGRRPEAYIRPSPSGGTLGGVARRTREALLVCEAAGFDVVLVETVGVGQSEIAVADLVDLFVLVAAPGGGDELQGIKRGIMELADVVVVNKADGDLLPAAQRSASDLRRALHLVRPKRPGWEVPVLLASALEGDGVAEAWRALTDGVDRLRADGALDALRTEQAVAWMWSELQEELLGGFRSDPGVQELLPAMEAELRAGTRSPASAARVLLEAHQADGAARD